MHIREASDSDLEEILLVERTAFGQDEEAELVRDLVKDATARPTLSLVAVDGDRMVGHVLFTAVRLPQRPPEAAILAPLAVVPDAQRRGVGGQLVKRGLQLLTERGVDLVFVLGDPGYYTRFGFEPAGRLGFEAAYPIPPEHADAWMVQALRPGVIGSVRGKISCAESLDRPELWLE